MRHIVVGTRGSSVALAQARWVVSRLKEEWPETEFRLSTVLAKGAAGEHASVADLERALSDKKIDIAVHSLWDLPIQQPEGLEVASIPRRLEARVALVGRAGCKSIAALPAGVVVGVTHPLRQALLKSYRPDLSCQTLGGDVDDRLAALGAGDVDALLISASDLIRLELRNRMDELIASEIMLPLPGQGAMALEVRDDDDLANECAYGIHHRASDDRITAERAFLGGLFPGNPDGNQTAPVGALATISDDGTLTLEGCVATPDGSQVIRASIEGDPEEAEDLGAELAEDVLKQGGEALLKVAQTA